MLEAAGFRIAADMLDAKRYGIPQARRRFILIASRHGQSSLPPRDAESEVRTVRDCIARHPAIADASILLRCHQKNPDAHKDVFGRMVWDSPSPTMTCRCIDVYCGRFARADQDRGISLREAAALQSFPDDYEFYGKSLLEKSRQIGNAAPVDLAWRLGAALLGSL